MKLKFLALLVSSALPRFALSASMPLLPNTIVHPADQNPSAAESCAHTATSLSCVQYLYNHDGDTLTVRIVNVHPLLGERISVRVHGIDTPELYSADPCERRAARIAQRVVKILLTNAQRVDLVSVQRDKYFRILADVRADGASVAQVLLSQGLAYPYHGGTKISYDWCEAANAQ
ncbi:MAG: thermonuclease family protein [Betaproteobacteria bacterium]|nr:thermonuclease family protein [Betaproteobacteria bacterium]